MQFNPPKISKITLPFLATVLGFSLVGCTTPTKTSSNSPLAPKQTVTVNAVTGEGIQDQIGTISFQDSAQGLLISTDLSKLPPGKRGFHIHEKGNCSPAEKDGKMGAALSAGSHFNPLKSAGHGTPKDGHLGDLPALNVDATGHAKTQVIAPRLKLADIQGLAIMVHAGGDNYSDDPKPLGGGGDRIACGVIR